jgi:hypothetical protein
MPQMTSLNYFDGLPKSSVLCRIEPTFTKNGLIVLGDPDAVYGAFMV